MGVPLSLGLRLSLRRSSCRGLSRVVILDVVGMAFLADMFFSVIGVDESLMSNKEITSRKGLGTDITNERLFLRVRSDMALQMFLTRLSQ